MLSTSFVFYYLAKTSFLRKTGKEELFLIKNKEKSLIEMLF